MTRLNAQLSAPFSLYEKQYQAVDTLDQLGGCALFAGDMGVGKTRTSLYYTAMRSAGKMLIVCPLSVARVWEQEIKRVLPTARVLVLPGNGGSAAQAAHLHYFNLMRKPGIVITNYDSYWRTPLKKMIFTWQPDTVILDEAQRIKHHTSKRAKMAHELGDAPWCLHKLALTGTPTDARLKKMFLKNARLKNLFSIYRFVNRTLFGTDWKAFQKQFCVMQPLKNAPINIVGSYTDVATIERRVRSTSVIIHKEEIVELPPCVDVPVPFSLGPKTTAYYNKLKRDAIVEIQGLNDDKEHATGFVVARIVLAALLKLQQIACGSVIIQEPTGEKRVIDVGSEKLDVCMELIEDAIDGTNVVVGCRFNRDVRRIEEACKARKINAVLLVGGMSKAARDQSLNDFDRKERTVLIANIQAGSLGINLTVSNVCILFSCGYALDDFIQFHDRLWRTGQKRSVTYFHLIAEHTVDEKIFNALSNGINIKSKAKRLAEAKELLT